MQIDGYIRQMLSQPTETAGKFNPHRTEGLEEKIISLNEKRPLSREEMERRIAELGEIK